MKLHIRIKTPDGMASGVVSWKRFTALRIMLGVRKDKRQKIITNKKQGDNQIDWFIEDSVKRCLKISKNVNMFETIMTGALSHKWLKKAMKKGKMSKEDQAQLKDMLVDMTRVEIVK